MTSSEFLVVAETEFYDRPHFVTHLQAVAAVSRWIDSVYNRRRRNSALGQINPVAFERNMIERADQQAA